MTNLMFLGSKITADGDCSHEVKRCLLLGRKAMINLDSILKSRDITLPTKVCLVKAMSWLIGKDSDAGRDWGQEEKGMIGDEMAGWHHWLGGHKFGWIPGVGDGQGVLARCSSWACKESDKTEWLNWTEVNCRQEMFFFILLEELIKETVFELNEIRVWWKFIWGFIWSKPQNEYNKHIQMQFLISVPLLNLIIRKMCLQYII